MKSTPKGFVDLDDLAAKLDDQVAVFMITNPNTLGMFEPQIERDRARWSTTPAGLMYLDGANMNAILGITRPGDFGADMMHFNPHKTFSGPHGGGGPGAGPIAVAEKLAPFLPVADRGQRTAIGYHLDYNRPKSIGRVRSFFGNVGVLVRMYCYIRTHGPDGPAASRGKCGVQRQLPAVAGEEHSCRCRTAIAACTSSWPRRPSSRAESDISAMDIAKRLLDYGFHAPTVYFPLIVREA